MQHEPEVLPALPADKAAEEPQLLHFDPVTLAPSAEAADARTLLDLGNAPRADTAE